jgi:hypothetical protein
MRRKEGRNNGRTGVRRSLVMQYFARSCDAATKKRTKKIYKYIDLHMPVTRKGASRADSRPQMKLRLAQMPRKTGSCESRDE